MANGLFLIAIAGKPVVIPQSSGNPLIEESSHSVICEDPLAAPRLGYFIDPMATYSGNQRSGEVSHQNSPDCKTPSVSNCYVFKSRLQEFAQKAGLPTPVYETIKEGPSHEPSFKSTVTVNSARYDSLPGFFNRKAAEQSAAEVALIALSQSGEAVACISQPVHETGLCKNMLQEYAQKMNYAIPMYEFKKDDTSGRVPMYSCTVDVGGMKYIGAATRTKKEAEIKAARTALLAIQATSSVSSSDGQSIYMVLPNKRKVPDLGTHAREAAAALKPKRRRFKKKSKQKLNAGDRRKNRQIQTAARMELRVGDQSVVGSGDANAYQVTSIGFSSVEALENSQQRQWFMGAVETTTGPYPDRGNSNGDNSQNLVIEFD